MNSKPHIFLDIDGVLALLMQFYSNPKKWNPKMNQYSFDPKAVKVFNAICEAVDPVIILSSDWKTHYTLEQMNGHFEWNGLTHSITAFTPSSWGVIFKSLDQLEECRAYEILEYVKEHEIENWVAIDDLDLKEWIPNNFVQTPRSNEVIKQSAKKDKIIIILLN